MRVCLAKAAFIVYLERTGKLRVYLARGWVFFCCFCFVFNFLEYLGILVQSDLNKRDKSRVYLTEEATI